MESFLYTIVTLVSQIHNSIMSANDNIEYTFTDKELHFITIGLIGLSLIFVIHPIFNWLARENHILLFSL